MGSSTSRGSKSRLPVSAASAAAAPEEAKRDLFIPRSSRSNDAGSDVGEIHLAAPVDPVVIHVDAARENGVHSRTANVRGHEHAVAGHEPERADTVVNAVARKEATM